MSCEVHSKDSFDRVLKWMTGNAAATAGSAGAFIQLCYCEALGKTLAPTLNRRGRFFAFASAYLASAAGLPTPPNTALGAVVTSLGSQPGITLLWEARNGFAHEFACTELASDVYFAWDKGNPSTLWRFDQADVCEGKSSTCTLHHRDRVVLDIDALRAVVLGAISMYQSSMTAAVSHGTATFESIVANLRS